MKSRPSYFQDIYGKTRDKWKKLKERSIAGPWYRLFEQVKAPDHVISELIQNADDAGAQNVWISLEPERLTVEHDGADFDKNTFEALCNFGLSSKRTIRTIGFRGMGFKSVFTFGSAVELVSPTLSVVFKEDKFTLPIWTDALEQPAPGRTRVRVSFTKNKQQAHYTHLERHLKERWSDHPTSLIFLRSVSRIFINERELCCEMSPPADEHWGDVLLTSGEQYGLMRLANSSPERLPKSGIEELKKLRELESVEDFPDFQVSLIRGLPAPQRLYVVLPTNVEVRLPFSINAPFVQDPARTKILEPQSSETNQWLLQRAGKLAARMIRQQLEDRNIPAHERAGAYDLLPERATQSGDLGPRCELIVCDVIAEQLRNVEIILSWRGSLKRPGECFALPNALHHVWRSNVLTELAQQHLLPAEQEWTLAASEIDDETTRRLEQWGWLHHISLQSWLNMMRETRRIPKPDSNEHLAVLWHIAASLPSAEQQSLPFAPAHGRGELTSPERTYMSDKLADRAISTADRVLLAPYLSFVDPNWLAYVRNTPDLDIQQKLLEQLCNAENDKKKLNAALRGFALDYGLIPTRLITKPYPQHVPTERRADSLAACAALLQLLARYDLSPPKDLFIASVSNVWDHPSRCLFHQITESSPAILPLKWIEARAIHQDCFRQVVRSVEDGSYIFAERLSDQESRKLRKWLESHFSMTEPKLLPPTCHESYTYKVYDQLYLARLNSDDGETLSYQKFKELSGGIQLDRKKSYNDYDWPADLKWSLDHRAKREPELWADLLTAVLEAWDETWDKTLCIEFPVRSLQKQVHPLTLWLVELRDKPCVRDADGVLHRPREVYRATQNTRALQGHVPFLHEDYTPLIKRASGAWTLLRQLGVQHRIDSPDTALGQLEEWSQNPLTPLDCITASFALLDKIVTKLDKEALDALRARLDETQLLYTADGTWVRRTEACMANPYELPGIAVLHPALVELPLCRALRLSDGPTVDVALNRFAALEDGVMAPLGAAELLRREPQRVWEETGGWLALDGRWRKRHALRYIHHNDQRALKASSLEKPLKAITASLSMLTKADVGRLLTHIDLGWLDASLEFQVDTPDAMAEQPALIWLQKIGERLTLVKLDEAQTQDDELRARWDQIMSRAELLQRARVWTTGRILITPTLHGASVGQPQAVSAAIDLTRERILITKDLKGFRRQQELVKALQACFDHPMLEEHDIFTHCFERSQEYIEDLFAEVFIMGRRRWSAQPEPAPVAAPAPSPTAAPPIVEPLTLATSPTDEEAHPVQPVQTQPQSHVTPSPRTARPARTELRSALFKQLGFEDTGNGVWRRGANKLHEVQTRRGTWIERDAYGEEVRHLFVVEADDPRAFELPASDWKALMEDAMPAELVVIVGASAHRYTREQLLIWKQNDQLDTYNATVRVRILTAMHIEEAGL